MTLANARGHCHFWSYHNPTTPVIVYTVATDPGAFYAKIGAAPLFSEVVLTMLAGQEIIS
jgi:hypothetical protein